MDSTLTPNLIDEITKLRREVDLLKSTNRWRATVMPFVPLGAVRDFGFTSLDAASYTDLFRCDTLVTAPVLDYDIQTTDVYASSVPTSVDWRITGTVYFTESGGDFATVVLASGSGSGTPQYQGSVDLLDPSALGPEAMFRLTRFDFECKRTGGSGDGAALRLVRPPLLRLPYPT